MTHPELKVPYTTPFFRALFALPLGAPVDSTALEKLKAIEEDVDRRAPRAYWDCVSADTQQLLWMQDTP